MGAADPARRSSAPDSVTGGGFLGGLTERWLDLRDRLLAAPWFHRLAAATPFSRPMARRRARALYDLCAGFVYSQTLAAAVRLDLFDHLAGGPMSVAELARRMALPEERARLLLDATTSLGLTRRRAGAAAGADAEREMIGLGELGAALRGAPGVAEMVRHHALLYDDLTDPVALLRGEAGETRLGRYWGYAGAADPASAGADAVASYSELMAASQPFVAEETLDAYPVRRHRRLLDVGGGQGVFLAAAAARAPALQLALFDLPAVAERARPRFEALGLGDRVSVHGGSFFDDPLPKGADLISLVRVLYDHPDDAVRRILQAAHAAVEPGGVILVAEPMADAPGAAPIGAAYFGFYLLAMGGGRSRSPREIAALLEEAGFVDAHPRRTRRPLLAQVVTARRP